MLHVQLYKTYSALDNTFPAPDNIFRYWLIELSDNILSTMDIYLSILDNAFSALDDIFLQMISHFRY